MKYKINYRILIPIIILSIVSVLVIYSALTYTSTTLGNLALKQAIWYGVGWILVIILARLKNEYLYQHTWFLYIFGNVLLLLLLLLVLQLIIVNVGLLFLELVVFNLVSLWKYLLCYPWLLWFIILDVIITILIWRMNFYFFWKVLLLF